MIEYVSVCRVIPKPETIDLVINSKRTYFKARLICSISTKKTIVLTYTSEPFNLYEGEQWLAIQHTFSDISAHGFVLTITVVDHEGVQVGEYCRDLRDECEPTIQPLLKVKGKINRTTEGGTITIEIAGLPYRIHTNYNVNLRWLEDYFTTKEPIRDICILEEEIRREKERLSRMDKYPPAEADIEMIALRNMLSDSIVDYNCFRIHGAAFAVDQSGYIFTADSGTGKTTHMKLWMNNLINAYVVNGDQPFVKVGRDIMVCGSPWCGKERLNRRIDVPLKAIVIMERNNENSIAEISMKDALAELIRQIYRPSNPEKMSKTFQLLSMLDGRIRFYRYKFNNFSEDAFSVSYRKVHLGQ